MSIHDLEKEVKQLSPEKRDRLAAYLSYLRSKEAGENISGEGEEFVSWRTVREQVINDNQ